MNPFSSLRLRARRRVALKTVDWLIKHPGALPRRNLQRLAQAIFDSDRDRRIVLRELAELIKSGSPAVEHMPIDLEVEGELDFEHLAGLFASTMLDEYIITMNVRQSAYLFGLIRRMQAHKVIEIGRHWGGTTVLIAAALSGKGDFWSIADPRELDWDLTHRGRSLARPIEDQLADLLPRLGVSAHIVAGDPRLVEVDTGEVDVVHIDGGHSYDAAMSDFERFGMRVRPGGAVLFDDAVPDDFGDAFHTADVKRVVAEIGQRSDFRHVRTVKRLVHLERVG